jgi:hypothetical protein
MATFDTTTWPHGQKDLTRRSLLGGLTFSAAAVTAPMHMLAADFTDDTCNPLKHPVLSLPFVRDATADERAAGSDPRNFWCVEPSGSYAHDCALGAQYANAALDYMVSTNAPYLLQWSVFDMFLLRRPQSGVEIGFVAAFGRLAMQAHAAQIGKGGMA